MTDDHYLHAVRGLMVNRLYARPIRQVQCINSVHGHISGGIYQILTLISQITGTEIDHLIDDHQVGYGIVPTLIGYIRVLLYPYSSVTTYSSSFLWQITSFKANYKHRSKTTQVQFPRIDFLNNTPSQESQNNKSVSPLAHL